MRARPLLNVGDRVVFGGLEHTVVAIAGTTVRLLSAAGEPSTVLVAYLFAAADFEVIGSAPVPPLTSQGLLEGLPKEAAEAACRWERHLIEVETGLVPDAPAGAVPRPEYDPASRSLAAREKAKTAELKAAGVRAGLRTVQRMRRRYREQGLWGLVDGRYAPRPKPTGNVDSRLVDATIAAIEAQTNTSTGTKARMLRQVERFVHQEYGTDAVVMPCRATFYRLVDALSAGRHTFGSAVTRRQTANRPAGVFSATVAARPGEQVQIDTTPLDVMAVMDDGVLGRAELTIAVDIATRTICAAVLHPAGAKAVDAAASRGVDATKESSVAVVLAGILQRAEEGPGPDRRATAKARAATAMPRRLPIPLQALPAIEETDDEEEPVTVDAAADGEIVPFGLYDPFADGGDQ
ncbi:hypothetical protein ACWFQ8_11355 [Streptomyces sp. NPDC055254]